MTFGLIRRLMGGAAPLALGFLFMVSGAAAEEVAPSGDWEKTIARFEERDDDDPPPKGAILFVGSSSIRFWDTAEAFPKYETINRGFGGSHMADVLHFMDRIVLPYEPRQIVLYEGDNDIDSGKSPKIVFNHVKAFCERVFEALPDTRITFIAIKPSPARWELVDAMREANALVRAYAESQPQMDYVDVDTPMIGDDGTPREGLFISDGLHLNEQGYALWRELVAPYLTERE